jgi:hypothetical protein
MHFRFRSLWRIFSSTLAAFFGVQTDRNRQRDFSSDSPLPFILMGIVLASLLVLTLALVVSRVLEG